MTSPSRVVTYVDAGRIVVRIDVMTAITVDGACVSVTAGSVTGSMVRSKVDVNLQ